MPAADEDSNSASNIAQAYMTNVAAKTATGRAFVAMVVEYGGKEARLEIEVDARLVESTALPELMREELAALMDALEKFAEGEMPIAFKADA